jgi:hypothetical protein
MYISIDIDKEDIDKEDIDKEDIDKEDIDKDSILRDNSEIKKMTQTNLAKIIQSSDPVEIERQRNVAIAANTAREKAVAEKLKAVGINSNTAKGKCGPKYANIKCPDNKCCSKMGECGDPGSKQCLADCDNSFNSSRCGTTLVKPDRVAGDDPNAIISSDGRCGPSYNNKICPKNAIITQCCSIHGWCGDLGNPQCTNSCNKSFNSHRCE